MVLRHTTINFMERIRKFLLAVRNVNADSQFPRIFLRDCDHKIKNSGVKLRRSRHGPTLKKRPLAVTGRFCHVRAQHLRLILPPQFLPLHL
jgi:hypothetical protein